MGTRWATAIIFPRSQTHARPISLENQSSNNNHHHDMRTHGGNSKLFSHYSRNLAGLFKENLNASRPSAHPSVRGKKNVRTFRWDHRIGCKDKKNSSWHLNGFSDGSNIGSTVIIPGRNPPLCCTLTTLIAMQGHQTKTNSKNIDVPIPSP